MEQHPVPQHIASFEFKLFGNLTVRQFTTLAIPMSVALLFLFSNLPPFIKYSMAVLFGGIGGFAALVPIQGRPLDKWVVLFIKAIMAPTQRIWVKDIKLPEFLNVVVSKSSTRNLDIEPIQAHDREKLRAYLKSIPKNKVSPFDVKEQIAVQRLNLSLDIPQGGKLPPAIAWTSKTSPNLSNALPPVSPALPMQMSAPSGMPVSASEYRGDMASALPPLPPSDKKPRVKISHHAKAYVLPGIEQRLERNAPHIGQVVKAKVQLASDTNYTLDNIIPINEPGRRVRLVHGISKARSRKLHFAPPTGFDLGNLPIRGEAHFEVSEGLKNNLDSSFPNQIQHQPAPHKQETVTTPPSINKPSINIGDSPSAHVASLSQHPSNQVHHSDPQPQRNSDQKMAESDSRLAVSLSPLSTSAKPAEILSRAQIVPLTNKPNVLSGLIVDSTGGPIVGAIVTVLDEHSVPVRALKTNKLGQFLSATPLPGGQYMIDVDSPNASFEPLRLNVAGEVLAPLAIKPK